MALQKFTNNADSTMSGSLSQGSPTLTLATGGGAKFPSLSGSDYFYITIYQKDGGAEVRLEIAKCIARTSDTLTLERDVEGIAAAAGSGAGGWAYPKTTPAYADNNVYVSLRMTAGTADNLLQPGSIDAATSKATPVDADLLPLSDSAASFGLKKLTWANLKATIKTYYDALATTLTNKTINLTNNTLSGTLAQFNTACSDADFQQALVSGTNIKTVNSTSLLGSGDIAITANPAVSVVSGTTVNPAVANTHYVLTNVAATTVTLPASPAAGDIIWVTVANGLTTNVIARNGKEINGVAEDLTIDAANCTVQLRYTGNSGTTMWRIL